MIKNNVGNLANGGDWYCPLLQNSIDQGMCLDINWQRLGYFKADVLLDVQQHLGKSVAEISAVCENCPNNPVKTSESMNKYRHLYEFLAGYFPTHWQSISNTPEEVLNLFVAESPLNRRRAVVNDIDRILGSGFGEERLSQIVLDDLRCGYDPRQENLSIPEWLESVRVTIAPN